MKQPKTRMDGYKHGRGFVQRKREFERGLPGLSAWKLQRLPRKYLFHYCIRTFLQRYLIGGIFLCFSPRQESLCKKGEVGAQPAAERPEKTEKRPNDVETGAASAGDD
ncbi:hypothetical protein QTG54_009163 [Skeletonema marinoi]|uniref:Uncharacterized protein n=1 Tax=Skeletonema marinoi TaxID=267567 RepID=A0AAD8Y5V1_9STRA|nr:hypothetical protein QTG54_009163 [Skeletonema marinoi]